MTRAVALQFEVPGGSADPLGKAVHRPCRQRADAPACQRRARLRFPSLVQKEAKHARLAGAQRQAPAGGEVESGRPAADFAEHGSKTRAAEALLERPERLLRAFHLDEDQAAGIDAELPEARPVRGAGLLQRSAFADPQHRTAIDGDKAGEKGKGKAVRGSAFAGERRADFMEARARQTAGKAPIRLRQPKGKAPLVPAIPRQGKNRRPPLKRGDRPAEVIEIGPGHGTLFSFCSHKQHENKTRVNWGRDSLKPEKAPLFHATPQRRTPNAGNAASR